MPDLRPRIIACVGAAFSALAPAGTAWAFDCDFYQRCCQEYVGALEEAGSPDFAIRTVEMTCTMHLNMPETASRALFCLQAWEQMSVEIHSQYERGVIGFYPDSCMADPMDLHELLEE